MVSWLNVVMLCEEFHSSLILEPVIIMRVGEVIWSNSRTSIINYVIMSWTTIVVCIIVIMAYDVIVPSS